LTGLWLLLVTTEKQIFFELMPAALLPHAWLLVQKKKKVTIQAGADSWICKNCNTENHNIRTRCYNCDATKDEAPAPSRHETA